MKAFEHWFGPYPFYEDSYKLVDAPHSGMEHQSATAYGNGYQLGYGGKDWSNSGEGLKWDFIIIHESGHEWFANSICSKDIADMWVHEGFTNYSETLFVDYYWGKEAGDKYIQGYRDIIKNDIPIIGNYGVNKEGSKDMYFKGGNLLHLIRSITNDDEKFRTMMIGLNEAFHYKTVSTNEIENYISEKLGFDFSSVFQQYLRTTKIPKLEYKMSNNKLLYRWANNVDGLKMPIKVQFAKGQEKWIQPTSKWKKIKGSKDRDLAQFAVDKNFYVISELVTSNKK
jgi:aminopeptidase N